MINKSISFSFETSKILNLPNFHIRSVIEWGKGQVEICKGMKIMKKLINDPKSEGCL